MKVPWPAMFPMLNLCTLSIGNIQGFISHDGNNRIGAGYDDVFVTTVAVSIPKFTLLYYEKIDREPVDVIEGRVVDRNFIVDYTFNKTGVDVSFGYIYYLFHSLEFPSTFAQDWYIAIGSKKLFLKPSIGFYQDVHAKGWYADVFFSIVF